MSLVATPAILGVSVKKVVWTIRFVLHPRQEGWVDRSLRVELLA